MSTTPKHKGLGRGLDALIKGGATRPGTAPAPKPAAAAPAAKAAAPAEPGTKAKGAVHLVPVHKIQKGPWQPRRRFAEEALKELADSIREKGVLEPVWLRRAGEIFHLIAGERRFRAAQLAGLPEIPALLHEVSDLEAREMALIENLQRADLDLIEEAEGYRDLMREAGLTQEEVAKRIGKARATVANALRLLDLSDAVKRALSEGALTAGHAKVLLGAAAADRDLLAARAIAQGLSVRALEKLVADLGRPKAGKKAAEPAKSAAAGDEKSARQLKFLADRMQQELGTKVSLTPARALPDGKREMGRIVIEFFDNEDLSRLLETLNLGDLA
ncbi:MAG TPA: ParB/RepB/Spo0J family partition protein [Kiritimatiellia bacterium]|nr:ParB/RepB/Spo0J family partition protein [Kiritimatiellia bacterium]